MTAACRFPGCDRNNAVAPTAFCPLHLSFLTKDRRGAIVNAGDPEERGIAIGIAIAAIGDALDRLRDATPHGIAAIMRDTADLTGVSVDAMRGPRQCRHVCRARFAAIHVARATTGHSLTTIGNLFRRDHTSVINADRRACEFAAADPDYAALVAALTAAARERNAFRSRSTNP